MSGIQRKYDEEFKKNAVKLSYASPKTVGQVAEDLGNKVDFCFRSPILEASLRGINGELIAPCGAIAKILIATPQGAGN